MFASKLILYINTSYLFGGTVFHFYQWYLTLFRVGSNKLSRTQENANLHYENPRVSLVNVTSAKILKYWLVFYISAEVAFTKLMRGFRHDMIKTYRIFCT